MVRLDLIVLIYHLIGRSVKFPNAAVASMDETVFFCCMRVVNVAVASIDETSAVVL